jgi:fibronectin type 3 domain-containing protein
VDSSGCRGNRDVIQTLPSAPQNLQASWGDEFVNISWLAPADDGNSAITNYKIYRGLSSGSETELTMIGNITYYNNTLLTNGVTYYYKVSAVNGVGEGPMSGGTSETPATIPSAPQNLTAAAGDGYVEIAWSAPSDIGGSAVTNYRIFRANVSGAETFYKQIGNVRRYNDTTVTNGETYYYQVKAKNAVGEGPMSGETSATPAAPVNQPPSSNITSIASGSTVTGSVVISGSSDDTDGTVEWVEMKIDDGTWFNVTGTTSWSYNLDTTTLSNGDHTIYIRSYDGEKYSEETSINLQVDNPSEKEGKSLMEESWFFPLIILIVIVIILVLFLMMRGKGAPAEELPDEVEEEPEEPGFVGEGEELEEEGLEGEEGPVGDEMTEGSEDEDMSGLADEEGAEEAGTDEEPVGDEMVEGSDDEGMSGLEDEEVSEGLEPEEEPRSEEEPLE